MSWIKKIPFIFLILTIITFVIGWKIRNFALCGFGASGILLFIAFKFKKLAVYLTPIIVTGLFVSLIEFSLFLVWPIIIPKGPASAYMDKESDYVKKYFQSIDGFGYLASEGKHTSRKFSPKGEIIYDVAYTIGKDGYRLDVPYYNHKIYIYGGSVTFGEGLNDNETISHYLYKNHGLYSKNMGIHGFGLHQALFNIQNDKTAVEGFNILVTFPRHASRSACKPSYAAGTPRYIIDNNNKLILDSVCKEISFLNNLLNKSYIFKLLDHSLFKSVGGKPLSNQDIEIYLKIIEEIAYLTKQKNSKLIIAYMFHNDSVIKKNTKWTNQLIKKEYEKIADLAINVTLGNTLEQLPAKYYIHKLDQHPSAKANFERASILKNFLD
tara:strand:- start:12805 stop:13947 length:1143 start_codon:yes stop_codon:yes gene_type:complete